MSARVRAGLAVPAFCFLVVAARAQQLPTAIPQTKFASGQNVVPYFEGWIRNPDGSFDLVFGYFNRNWEEALSIPVGPGNVVSPGPADQGQPTFFAPRRQGWVYRVRVPKDFGTGVVTWTITANGKTEKAYGELLPVEEITERIVMTRGNLNPGDGDPNKPPVVTVAPVTAAAVGKPVTLTAMVSDDGLPKPRAAIQRTQAGDATRIQQQTNSSATAERRGLRVSWMQLRGPARVAFGSSGAVPVADGKASTTAQFAQEGLYVLRVTANDGALATKADVTVTVGAAGRDYTDDKPVVDNERVAVWNLSSSVFKASGDSVWVSLAPQVGAFFVPRGGGWPGSAEAKPVRAVVVDLKDRPRAPLENRSGYPLAFPRPGVKKLVENDRVIVWDYTWTAGQPTPMHFHDKDVVVVYVESGALKSTTPDGQSTMNEFTAGAIRFNLRDRVHTELLTSGKARAIITELK